MSQLHFQLETQKVTWSDARHFEQLAERAQLLVVEIVKRYLILKELGEFQDLLI